MPTIVHFQIRSDDIERKSSIMICLDGSLTNFLLLLVPRLPEGMEYWMISTVDDQGNKAVGGGMMKRQSPQQGITNYFDVKSVQEYSAKVEQLGEKYFWISTPAIPYKEHT